MERLDTGNENPRDIDACCEFILWGEANEDTSLS